MTLFNAGNCPYVSGSQPVVPPDSTVVIPCPTPGIPIFTSPVINFIQLIRNFRPTLLIGLIWWEFSIDQPLFWDGTTIWYLGLTCTTQSGLTVKGVGIIDFLDLTGGVGFFVDAFNPNKIHVELIPYVGCTNVNPGIIGGVPPAAPNQLYYPLVGSGVWDTPLQVSSDSTHILGPSITQNVNVLKFEQQFFEASTSALFGARNADVTIANPITGIMAFDSGKPPLSQFVLPLQTIGDPTDTALFGSLRLFINSAHTAAELWVQLDNVVGGSDNVWDILANSDEVGVLTTKGDILTYDTGYQRLPKGADNTILVNDAAKPTNNKWITASDLLDAVFGNAQGSILMRGGAAWKVLVPGAGGSYLSSQGPGSDLHWVQGFTGVQTIVTNVTCNAGVLSVTQKTMTLTGGLVMSIV